VTSIKEAQKRPREILQIPTISIDIGFLNISTHPTQSLAKWIAIEKEKEKIRAFFKVRIRFVLVEQAVSYPN